MNPRLNQMLLSSFPFILTILVSVVRIPGYLCQPDRTYETCSERFDCDHLEGLGYPFWGGERPESCGHPAFQLTGCGNDVPLINISSDRYRVLDIDNTTQTPRIARQDLWDNLCPILLHNTSLDSSFFDYYPSSGDQNITLYYGCSINPGVSLPYVFNCNVNGTPTSSFYTMTGVVPPGIGTSIGCNDSVIVPVNQTAARILAMPAISNGGVLQAALANGFTVQWSDDRNCRNCMRSNGVCGYSSDSESFACYCSDRPYAFTCNDTRFDDGSNGNQRNRQGIKIALPIAGAVLAGIGLGFLIFYCRQRRKQLLPSKSSQALTKEIKNPSSKSLSSLPSTQFTQSIPSYPSSNSDLRKGSTYFGVHVFDYAELETATEFFDPTRELGDGGFGIVYYGVLSDGRKVAVKRLYENNFKRMEQFMNELEILTRLSHENLVKLYGCTSRRSRELLLVYEFIPNGTVGDHLHGKRAKSGLLSWPVRLNIAIETAEALAYLHKSDIIHRDVKTNNILLDNDFHVKVADFGLSRLFPNDVTHVSTAPQGTPGYVDPEYYQCYQLTEKSDVYSFGVVLVELISSLQAVDTNRHRQDINLANMAVNKIQNHSLHELVDTSLGFETDSTVRRKATLVAELAFRCLQQERDLRPSMVEVLETLKRIKNDDLNVDHKVEILVDDDVAPLRGSVTTSSPDSTDKWTDGSTPSSSR